MRELPREEPTALPGGMGIPLFSLENLSFWYPGSPRILHSLTLSIQQGFSYGLLGPNGSGKTTLLKLLAGILRSYEGSFRLMGKELSSLPPRQVARKVAFMPQEASFSLNIPVEYFLLLSRYPLLNPLKGFSKEDYHRVDEVLERIKISSLRTRRILELSGGEKRKILLASLLVTDADTLILDEPEASLDPPFQREIREILLSLKGEGKTLIFTSHDLELLVLLSDNLIALREGTLLACEPNRGEQNASLFRKLYSLPFTPYTSPDGRVHFSF